MFETAQEPWLKGPADSGKRGKRLVSCPSWKQGYVLGQINIYDQIFFHVGAFVLSGCNDIQTSRCNTITKWTFGYDTHAHNPKGKAKHVWGENILITRLKSYKLTNGHPHASGSTSGLCVTLHIFWTWSNPELNLRETYTVSIYMCATAMQKDLSSVIFNKARDVLLSLCLVCFVVLVFTSFETWFSHTVVMHVVLCHLIVDRALWNKGEPV